MKKFIPIVICLLISGVNNLYAQSKSCCSSGTAAFAMLGTDSDFQAAHLSPEPFHFQAMKGMMATFDTPDGKKGSAFVVPSMKKTDNYLFVFHEWWGLNDYVKQEAERLANDLDGVNVMAIDLYDGKQATIAEDAAKLMEGIKTERAEAIIKGAIAYIRTNARIQTIGYCFGGGWSLKAAILAGNKASGCIIYYGMPEKDKSKLKNLSGPVMGHFALKDNWITKEVVNDFESTMSSLKKPIEIYWYDAAHAFANPSNPKYDAAAGDAARERSLKFIRKNFGL